MTISELIFIQFTHALQLLQRAPIHEFHDNLTHNLATDTRPWMDVVSK